MRYVIILASGVADEPVEALGGKTPLAAARTPALDELAREGKTGGIRTLPEGLPASEDVALLAALGYDPHKYFSGEAGLAVADSGLRVGPDRLAFVHNLTTEANGILSDHAAGQITPKEAEALLTTLSATFGRPEVQFYAGRGFSGVTVLPVVEGELPVCEAPEAALGAPIDKHLPRGKGSDLVRRLMRASQEVFREHEINRVRTDLGENPATLLWLWGPGRPPALPAFEARHKLRAAMVAAAESARGLGRLAGMRLPHLPGATGTYRTDLTEKAHCVLDLIYEMDLVVVHVAAPGDASLEGNVQRKVAAIQDLDAMLVGPILQFARRMADTRVLFLSTHVASVMARKRLRTDAPFAMFGPGIEPLRQADFTESAARSGEIGVEHAHELLPYFLTR